MPQSFVYIAVCMFMVLSSTLLSPTCILYYIDQSLMAQLSEEHQAHLAKVTEGLKSQQVV